MAYALESLMKIRLRREDAARSELTAAQLKVAEAKNELEARKNDLLEYERTKDERRDRIYAAVIGRTVTADDLALAREGVSRIDDEGNLKADNVVRAEGVLKDRQNEAAVAREGFVLATKNRMKIDEHRENYLREEAAWAERRQEIELEDFTGKKVIDDRDE
jgi:type III secretion protein O